jgi:hypothetical protein
MVRPLEHLVAYWQSGILCMPKDPFSLLSVLVVSVVMT